MSLLICERVKSAATRRSCFVLQRMSKNLKSASAERVKSAAVLLIVIAMVIAIIETGHNRAETYRCIT